MTTDDACPALPTKHAHSNTVGVAALIKFTNDYFINKQRIMASSLGWLVVAALITLGSSTHGKLVDRSLLVLSYSVCCDCTELH